MLRIRNIIGTAILAIAAAVLSAGAASAADYDLDGYEIIIGDTGDRYEGWDHDELRTFVEVRDSRGQRHDGYFDSIASAFFVLKEKYGSVQVLDIGVPDFGDKYGYHGPRRDYGLIDGRDAWYFWDNDRRARGGLPLIYSFYDRRDASDFARRRDGEIMDFDEVVYNLKRWHDSSRSRVYWRGWDTNHHWTTSRWNSAWNHRWNGYRFDRNDGWALRLNIDRDGDLNVGGVRYRNNGVGVVINNNDRHDNGNRSRGRSRGNGNGRARGHDRNDDRRDNDDRNRDNDDDNKDNSGKYGRERDRERNR
jgi:hypothetical protein